MRSSIHVTLFLVALGTLAFVHILSTTFYLYWKYTYLDMAVHILGGTTVALGLFLLPVLNVRIPRRFSRLPFVLLTVLAMGVVWELFEFFSGVTVGEQGFWVDTLSDLTMDVLGGCIGYGVATRLRHF